MIEKKGGEIDESTEDESSSTAFARHFSKFIKLCLIIWASYLRNNELCIFIWHWSY